MYNNPVELKNPMKIGYNNPVELHTKSSLVYISQEDQKH